MNDYSTLRQELAEKVDQLKKQIVEIDETGRQIYRIWLRFLKHCDDDTCLTNDEIDHLLELMVASRATEKIRNKAENALIRAENALHQLGF